MTYCHLCFQNWFFDALRKLSSRWYRWRDNNQRRNTVDVIRIRRDGSRVTEKIDIASGWSKQRKLFWSGLMILIILGFTQWAFAEGGNGKSLNLPSDKYGISFGNSQEFTGLRINFRDRNVRKIDGINLTLWAADHNERAIVRGLSLGLLPEAGKMTGVSLGIAGVASESSLRGLSVGLIGVGAGEDIRGINLGGVGVGSGGSIAGINIGGIGLGAGQDLSGINFGGVGVGAGEELSGISIGLFGVGAGTDMTGISFGGFGAGAGGDISGLTVSLVGAGSGGNTSGITIGGIGVGAGGSLTGLNIAGIGVGAGHNMTGINLAGIGVGAGSELKWISIGGVGVGAPYVTGFAFGGAGAGGEEVTGVIGAIGMVSIENDGLLTGVSAAAFNRIKGHQRGVSIGIVNYARSLKGFQFGLINYVRDNPRFMKVLPLLNFNFSD